MPGNTNLLYLLKITRIIIWLILTLFSGHGLFGQEGGVKKKFRLSKPIPVQIRTRFLLWPLAGKSGYRKWSAGLKKN